MFSVGYYFQVPREFGQHLGGLRWSRSGEVIEYPDGSTFAFRSEIGLFLEGFAGQRRLIHFGFVLHLLHLLGASAQVSASPAPALLKAFRKIGRPLRNAGAFCGVLCGSVPAVPGELDPETVCRQLYSGSLMSLMYVGWRSALPEERGEFPPLNPSEFQERVLHGLRKYTEAEIEHWLRHGRGPLKEASDQLVQELETIPPRTLHQVLAAMTQRPRLAAAVPFVKQLVSALTLPPRKRWEEELPTGGYADVCTRGHPEQLLPSQFGLDELDFLRRFAENELLYFHREEPHARTPQELVLVLDQGVRTWGDVRLLLSAAVFAFGKLAIRRGMPLRVAATSSEGGTLDPLEATEDELGELLDASDLSANPGLALERVLEEPAEVPRDVVLLTHLRNLAEPDVAAAARRSTGTTRLFTLAAEANGKVVLSHVKRGVPMPMSRFRVDLTRGAPQPEPKAESSSGSGWSGDVERVPFPFRLKVLGKLDARRFDFDHYGNWLFALEDDEYVHAWKLDGTVDALLPRGLLEGHVLHNPDALLGTLGGCVLVGRVGKRLGVVHYHVLLQTCKTYLLGWPQEPNYQWFYFEEYNSVVARGREVAFGVDLSTGTACRFRVGKDEPRSRVEYACRASKDLLGPRSALLVSSLADSRWPGPRIHLDRESGELNLTLVEGRTWQHFTPLQDGRPLLARTEIHDPAHLRGNVVAFNCKRAGKDADWVLRAFAGPEGIVVGEFPQPYPKAAFALSEDGRLLARHIAVRGKTQLKVHDLQNQRAEFITPRGRTHSGLQVELGNLRLAIHIGRMTHLIEWGTGRLEVTFTRSNWHVSQGMKAHDWIPLENLRGSDWLTTLGHGGIDRYVRGIMGYVTVLLDRFGNVAVLGKANELVCMFFAFRERLAAWMPDGTCLGNGTLLGGPETPGAHERIGQALLKASSEGKEVRE